MSNGLHISLHDRFTPPESEMILKIDFDEREGSPARVFEIAADLIRAFDDLDSLLVTTIDSKISTELVLEDLEKSSIKIFLRSLLKQVDDQALKDLDWKPLVGQYLVKGKYLALEWLDKNVAVGEQAPIEDLTDRIRQLASATDVRQLPDYPPISPMRLAQPLDNIQRAKSKFRPGEGLTITLGREEYNVDVNATWLPSEHLPPSDLDQALSNEVDMVLVIRRPDLLGASQWQFRHGKKLFNAVIEDTGWLEDFHDRKFPLTPGDALRVRVRFDYIYDRKGNLVKSEQTIIKVYGVIPSAPNAGLFDD